ncbi:putative amidoligase domain-containing protein [Paenibacillus terrigena]|uniref:putative amidoligase domain-containing protein n=1 Tax=Paenibacillus terrigena TaxID=369333 RepID=UPI0003621D2C|nr:hypothetical protein [Paenibacillus terrigena]
MNTWIWTDGEGMALEFASMHPPNELIHALRQVSGMEGKVTRQPDDPVPRMRSSQATKTLMWVRWEGTDATTSKWLARFHEPQSFIYRTNCDASQLQRRQDVDLSTILARHGVPISQEKGIRRYKVHVYHLRVLAVFRCVLLGPSGLSSDQPIDLDRSDAVIRRICRLAIRALYCVGWDIGEVHIEQQQSGGMVVVESLLSPPELSSKELARHYAQAMLHDRDRFRDEAERSTPAMLGMDPEFILYDADQGKAVSASKFLPKEGPVGCDAVWVRSNGNRLDDEGIEQTVTVNSPIYPLVELRPEPREEPRDLIIQLMRTMQLAARTIPDSNLRWLAGGMPLPGLAIGGHIHFSGLWLNAQLLRVLDNYIALPIAIIEAKTSARRRPRYGILGDFRVQPHSGFEYRTLPSWLVSPVVTKGVIALAQLVALEYRLLTRRYTNDDRVVEAFYEGNSQFLADYFEPLYDDLSHLPSYGKYARYIEPLMDRIRQRVPWDEQQDIRKLWKIPPFQ